MTEVKSIEEVVSFLESFRPGDNRKYDEEIFCLYLYLYARFQTGLLAYPISFTKREAPDFPETKSPDFDVGLNEDKVGLEVTRATDQNYKHELGKYGIWRGEYQCNLAQEEFCDAASTAISEKTGILNGQHYDSFPSNELFIFCNTPLDSAIDSSIDAGVVLRPSAIDQLRSRGCNSENFDRTFHKIHILLKGQVYLDVFGEIRQVDVSEFPRL